MKIKKRDIRKWIQSEIFDQYLQIIESVAYNLLTVSGLPDTINSMQVLRAVSTGMCGIVNIPVADDSINNGWVCAPAVGLGVQRENGTFAEYEILLNTGAVNVSENENVYILRNGYNLVDSRSIFRRVAANLTEIAKSERKLVKGSRISPIIRTTSINAPAYKEVCTNIYDNDSDVNVVVDNDELIAPGTKRNNDSIISVTDPDAISKMHFLAEYFEEEIRRLSTFFGVPFSTTSKSAQNLRDEIHDMDILSQFVNESALHTLREDITRGNAKTGLNISIDYSDIIKKQLYILDHSPIVGGEPNGDNNSPDIGTESGGTDSAKNTDNSTDN
jgi:hypothetical protein